MAWLVEAVGSVDDVLAPLLTAAISFLATAGFLLLFVFVLWVCSDAHGVQLGEGLPGAYDDAEQFYKDEQLALIQMDQPARAAYLAAKRFTAANPPNSVRTDMTLGQYLSIQEQGVGAWEFPYTDFDEYRTAVQVANRTEIEFLGPAMCVQTNLPLPAEKEVYYWEAKLYGLPRGTKLAIGLATKPYPAFRLPGMHRFSVAYEAAGQRRLNQPFAAPPYGRAWLQGDVIGVGYRPRTGVVFFTHNGKKLPDVVQGMRFNLFPSLGAVGPCSVHVNFGGAGFVFIEANVKRWGLAPAQGSLLAPPAYGDQTDSVLLDPAQPARRPPSFRSHSGEPPAYDLPGQQQPQQLAAEPGWPTCAGAGEADGPASVLHTCAPPAAEGASERCPSAGADTGCSHVLPPAAPPKPSLEQVLAEALEER